MNKNDYFGIIEDAYDSHMWFLDEFFFRQYNKATKSDINHYEFFTMLREAHNDFVNQKDVDQKFYDNTQKVLDAIYEVEQSTSPKNKRVVTATSTGTDSLKYIKQELHELLFEKEKIIKEKIDRWKQGKWGRQLECAAFCFLLLKNKYFRDSPKLEKEKAEMLDQFAFNRYGVHIKIQLIKKQGEMKSYIRSLKKCF